jgi:hypothetical protein
MYKLITDYTIISVSGTAARNASAIASKAKRLIKDGWTPLGSITSDNNGALYQVMIKYTQPDDTRPVYIDPDRIYRDR